ncbi:MAG: ATP-binding cassette domain-containing protein [Synergistaceae bacterium]|jgi:ribose transport system ATP-binding protein|nr:ATP-binding cassette domain-containing protein [Synergistaceae bacterium]
MENENFFEIRNLNKSFNRIHAVNDVSFSIAKGEVHALLGENGAGKSTLMNLLAGVYKPDSGEMLFDGKPYNPENTSQARENRVSIVFQELSLFTLQTASDNIFAGKELTRTGRLDRRGMAERSGEILKEMELDIDSETPIKNLSIGQRQWVEIARALADDARVLILDEPNSALNIYETKILFKIIARLKEKGITIIYISHRLDEVFEIADRITIMRDGQYIVTLKKEESSVDTVIPIMLNRKTTKLFERTQSEVGENVLDVQDVCVSDEIADISFKVASGEVVGLCGLAGCGIETILQALFGLRGINSGSVKMMDREIFLRSAENAMRSGISMVPSDRREAGLILDWSITDNIAMSLSFITARYGILNHKRDRDISSSYAKQLNIVTESVRTKVLQLSGGNQQKVLLAKWLATNPKLLILDDPTRGVDVGAKKEVYELIDSISKQGLAVILMSSEIDELTSLSDRIILFRDGRIIHEIEGGADKETILKYIAGDAGINKEKASDPTDGAKSERGSNEAESQVYARLRKFFMMREVGVFMAFLVVACLFSIFIDGFMTQNNASIILKQMSVLGIITFGMTFVFATGEVDVSVGWLLNAAMSFAAMLMVKYSFSPWAGAAAGVCFAMLLGACNGVLAISLNLPTIVVTLGTMTIFRGFALSINHGRTISGLPTENSFFDLGRTAVGGISLLTVVALAVFALCLWVFYKTKFSRHLLLNGDNSSAAEKCGVNIKKCRFSVMLVSGFLVGIASMLSLSNLTAADTTTGGGYELAAIGAVIVGGTKMGGGSGTIWGSLIGIVLITTIQNGLVFLGLQIGWRSVFIGMIIIIAISIDFLVQKHRTSI